MNYYAVKKGREIGIFTTWDECKKQVMGFGGAMYKKFPSREEAEAFIGGKVQENKTEDKKIVSSIKDGEIIAYVDGSYDKNEKSYSYGMVLTDGVNVIETDSKRFFGAEDASMRNVAGEIMGSKVAIERALELGYKKIYLHYDYMGIECWAVGSWKANKVSTQNYRDFYAKVKDKIEVEFIKVQAHTGVEFNELADKLAKGAK
ncbi:ribonuclease HI [Peptoniphilus asaccharolyticus DSM 20463]|uniref:ribonuclease H n=1 Tax=Peptoniphilus asaccharolyticus DSM 20463 TaxID=573058 RepID=A0A1W1V4G1_PEPAS|nr:ribonuclease H family protein [Peptoniphilus asaccharolyticus]MBL7576306.1 ribonuclease H family protein [Peptoniphilus asaccharolyticus]SMB88173.1 ribonuclease HI [Peptoniphilus asaccharolyticus DSM 20463]